jgi:hypothetical protein
VLLEGPVDVLGDERGDHVHDVVPVIAQPVQALNRVPCPGRVVGQQLVRHDLVHCYVQPRVDGLAIDDHIFIAAQRVCEFRMLRLDQERALVLVAWVQQLEIESLIDPVRRGDRPRAPVSGVGLVELAVRRLLPVHSRLIPGPCGQPMRSAPARCRTPARLTAPATVWRAAAASRTHRTIVPAPTERVTRKSAT